MRACVLTCACVSYLRTRTCVCAHACGALCACVRVFVCVIACVLACVHTLGFLVHIFFTFFIAPTACPLHGYGRAVGAKKMQKNTFLVHTQLGSSCGKLQTIGQALLGDAQQLNEEVARYPGRGREAPW